MKSITSRRTLSRAIAALFVGGVAISALIATPMLHGAIYYWDQNGTTAGFGMAGGSWDTSGSSTWNTVADGTGTIVSTSTLSTNATTDAVNFGTATDGLAAGTITVGGTVQAGAMTFGSASGAITLSGGTIDFLNGAFITASNTTNTISSNISGGASLNKYGSGTLVLTAANTFSGGLSIQGGTVRLANTSALSSASSITLTATAGNKLEFGTDTAFSALSPLSLSSSGSQTLVSDRATAGPGLTHVLGAVNIGDTTVAFNSGTNVTSGTAEFQFTNMVNTNTANAGTATLAPGTGVVLTIGTLGTTSTAAAKTYTLAGIGTGFVTGAITNGGVSQVMSITKNNTTSTWTLSGTGSNYSGATTISGGTLIGIGTNAFGNTSGITIAAANNATLSLRGDSSTNFQRFTDSLLYPVTTTASGATINVDQATVAGTSAKTMTIGTLQLNTAITNGTNFTGANNTSLSIGAVTTGNSASGTETLTNNISGGGSLTLASIVVNRSGIPTLAFAGNGNTTLTGSITEVAATALTKSGTGSLTLTGANSYTGGTTVDAGTLVVNNTTSSGTGTLAVQINSNGTLAGNGFITGAVIINGGTLAPGSSIDSLDTGTLSFTGGTFAAELNTTTLTSGLVNATGDLLISGSVTLSLADLGSNVALPHGTIFTLIGYSGIWNLGTFTGYADDSIFTLGANSYKIDYNDPFFGGSALTLIVQAVPEPSTLVLGGLALLGFAGAKLRKRRLAK